MLHFYFNAEQKGNSPTQFKEEITTIDFPEEVEKILLIKLPIYRLAR